MMLAGLSQDAQLECLRETSRPDKAPGELERLAAAWAPARPPRSSACQPRHGPPEPRPLPRHVHRPQPAFARQIKDCSTARAPLRAASPATSTGADSGQAQLKTLGVESERY